MPGLWLWGIDHTFNRFKKEALIINLDLTVREDQQGLWGWLKHPKLAAVSMAPPCGTSTRAKEKNDGGPRPLRSDDHPRGIPNLKPHEVRRVVKANAIYDLFLEVASLCLKTGILFFMDPLDVAN